MAGPVEVLDVTFEADLAIKQYCYVSIGAAAGSCKHPTSAAEGRQALGIAQMKATAAGQGVPTRMLGISRLVADEVLAVGDTVGCQYTPAAQRGNGLKLTLPAAPAAAVGPTAAEINLSTAYATAILTYFRDSKGLVLKAAGALNAICEVFLSLKAF